MSQCRVLKPRNLFEYGHPRLENLLVVAMSYQLSATQVAESAATTVLIAPTWGDQSIFNTCGDELTGLLLDAGYHVIVRPHYQTVKMTPEVIEKLREKYGDQRAILSTRTAWVRVTACSVRTS